MTYASADDKPTPEKLQRARKVGSGGTGEVLFWEAVRRRSNAWDADVSGRIPQCALLAKERWTKSSGE